MIIVEFPGGIHCGMLYLSNNQQNTDTTVKMENGKPKIQGQVVRNI